MRKLIPYIWILFLLPLIVIAATDPDDESTTFSDATIVSYQVNETGGPDNQAAFGDISTTFDEGFDLSDAYDSGGAQYTISPDLTWFNANLSFVVTSALPVSGVGSAGDPVTLGTDVIKDTHIDWGTAATQVDSDDVPNDITSFDGNLTGADTTVLAALETIDEMPIGGGIREYFLETTVSDIGGYKEMAPTYAADVGRNSSIAIVIDGTAIEEWATGPTEPNLTFLESGVYDMHVHVEQTGGTKTSTIYFELWKRASGGGEVLLGTSHETGDLTGASVAYSIHTFITEQALLSTDRLVIKVIGNEGGAGTDPVVQVNYQGGTLTRFEFPAQATVSSAIFIDQGGGTGGTYGTLTGLINGANDSYDTSRNFEATNLRVYLNGQLVLPDGDSYTVIDANTFDMVVAPPTNSILLAIY